MFLSNVDFESNNKLNLTTHADVKIVAGTAARTNNVHTIEGGFYSVGSSPSGNHVCIDVAEADTLNLIGVHARGSGFAKGVVAGANVNTLNLLGNFFQSVVIPVEATATTKVFDTHNEGLFLQNNVAFDAASAYARQDVILLRNEQGSAGVGEYGGSISGTSSAGGTNRRVSIAPIQTGADSDQMGWAFFTHPSASSVDMTETLVLNHSGYLEIGGSGGPMLLKGTNSPESVYTAPIGSIFMRTNGGAGTSMYVKESGTGNTGWVAK